MTHIKNLTFSSIEPSHYHEIFPNYIISTLTAHSYADLDENNTIKRQKNNLLNRLKSLEILLANSSFVDKASDSIKKQKEKELLEIKERLANLK
jgi:valyl-tRNA synthetase